MSTFCGFVLGREWLPSAHEWVLPNFDYPGPGNFLLLDGVG